MVILIAVLCHNIYLGEVKLLIIDNLRDNGYPKARTIFMDLVCLGGGNSPTTLMLLNPWFLYL